MKLTRAQRESLLKVYLRTVKENSLPSIEGYRAFRRTVQPYIGGDCVLVPALGMWFGIEKDGYTHT